MVRCVNWSSGGPAPCSALLPRTAREGTAVQRRDHSHKDAPPSRRVEAALPPPALPPGMTFSPPSPPPPPPMPPGGPPPANPPGASRDHLERRERTARSRRTGRASRRATPRAATTRDVRLWLPTPCSRLPPRSTRKPDPNSRSAAPATRAQTAPAAGTKACRNDALVRVIRMSQTRTSTCMRLCMRDLADARTMRLRSRASRRRRRSHRARAIRARESGNQAPIFRHRPPNPPKSPQMIFVDETSSSSGWTNGDDARRVLLFVAPRAEPRRAAFRRRSG